MMADRWRIERSPDGTIHRVLSIATLRGVPDMVVSDPLWAEVARLAAAEERERIVVYISDHEVFEPSIAECIERGEHWRDGDGE